MSAGCMVPKLRFAYVYRVLWLSQIECVIKAAALQCSFPAHSVQHADISGTACIFLSMLLADSPH